MVLVVSVSGRAWGEDALTIAQPLKETAWISQLLEEEVVDGAAGVEVEAQAVDLDPAVAAHAQWEIRTADETKRVARLSVPWIMREKGRETSSDFRSFHLAPREVRRMVGLEPGEYVMAWLLDGERRSNVVRLTVMKAGEKRPPGEYLWIEQGEPQRPGRLPMAEIRVRRRTEADPANESLIWAQTLIDGQPLTRKKAPGMFADPPMAVGGIRGTMVDWDQMKEVVDGSKPHTISVRMGEATSAPVALLTTTPLGDAWDAATAKLGPAPVAAVQVEGKVTGEDGKAGAGYAVMLIGGGQEYEEVSDGAGGYAFSGVPAGEYELTCVPGGKKVPLAVVSKVAVGAAKRRVDVTFEGKFAVSGKVEKPADDDGPAGPAVGRMVRATFVSEDGGVEVSVAAETGKEGAYEVKGPFEKVSFVGVMSSPEPAPVKGIVAPKAGVDFRLASEAEERTRVR
jgi:hypothetical protein